MFKKSYKRLKKDLLIIQYNWPIQSFTKLLAEGLANYYRVILYTDRWSLEHSRIDLQSLEQKGISIICAPSINVKFLKLKYNVFLNKLWYYFGVRYISIKKLQLRQFSNFLRSQKIPTKNVIAVEKEALVCAAKFLSAARICYYSLELYFDAFSNDKVFKYIRREEVSAIRNIDGLIIQDSFRESAFLQYNSKNEPINALVCYLPVSVQPSTSNKIKVNYWKNKFKLQANKKIILYFGLLKLKDRGLEDLIKSFEGFGSYVLVLHGFGCSSQIERIRTLAHGKPIYISTDVVNENNIEVLINSADLGLCWYHSKDLNNMHTAYSSEKIALFLRSKKPIITNISETYVDLYSKYKCGIGLRNLNKLRAHLDYIDDNYEIMSKNAFTAYEDLYDADTSVRKVAEYLRNIF